MNAEQLRVQALQMATSMAQQNAMRPGGVMETPEETTARAEVYFKFLGADLPKGLKETVAARKAD